MNKYRKDFPFFKAIDEKNSEENRDLIYFDTAATAQRPFIVLNAMTHFYATENANPLRGLYSLSERATLAYENARKTVAQFINAKKAEEIVFTRNASESLNLVAYSWGLNNLHEGDEICVTIMEHHSNIVPWQMVCQKTGARLVFLECDKETGIISDKEIETKITEHTKIVSVVHVSNVLGVTNPVKKLADAAHAVGAIFIVDGAQSTPHMKVDVQDIDADFFAMSAHKLCGPMGIGSLYGKYELLEKMEPFLRGGEMIEYVTREKATWAEVPHKFEAGTVSAGDAVGMAAAIRYIQSIGLENIEAHDQELAERMIAGIKNIPHVNIIGPDDASKRCGIITFTLDGVHPHDIATLLSEEHIAIRAGHHCAQPLGQYLGQTATARASLYFYNTEEEVDVFLEKLSHLREWSGYKN
ncbi:MAG: SufS family cysteine desulfurase [Treponema sp.]|nr:SufS family cysteine desulfurase [Treponema sp.]